VSHPGLAPATSFINSVLSIDTFVAATLRKRHISFQTCNVQTESVAANIAPIAEKI